MNRNKFKTLSKLAKRQERPMRRLIESVLVAQLTQFAREVSPVTDPKLARVLRAFQHDWVQQLIQAKGDNPLRMAVHGYRVTAAWMGHKKSLELLAAKADYGIEVDVDLFGADELAANHLRAPVRKWIARTSKIETQTTAKRMESIFHEAMGTFGADNSLTPKGLADAIMNAGLAQMESRADMMARTLTNWAYNEGAQTNYKDFGIDLKEWSVTDDDVLCDLCAPMDGVRTGVDDSFFGEGSVIERAGGAVYDVEMTVEHPPLHPNCRCCLVPVVEGVE